MWHILIRALNLALCQLRQAYMCPHSLFSNDASRKEIKDTVTDCNAPNPCYNLQQPMKKVYSWSTPRNMTPPEGSSHPLRNYSSPTHRIDMTGSAKVTRFDDMSFTGSFTNLALNFPGCFGQSSIFSTALFEDWNLVTFLDSIQTPWRPATTDRSFMIRLCRRFLPTS